MREESFGERLKNLRLKENLSQMELAKKLGVGKSVISKWERGESEASLSNLIRIVKFFNISLDCLAGLED